MIDNSDNNNNWEAMTAQDHTSPQALTDLSGAANGARNWKGPLMGEALLRGEFIGGRRPTPRHAQLLVGQQGWSPTATPLIKVYSQSAWART